MNVDHTNTVGCSEYDECIEKEYYAEDADPM